jgi:uncharacterized circularly permuted ATP-grasp superfamily protein
MIFIIDQKILKAGLVPAEQVLANDQYQPCMQGIDLHRDIYAHIAGTDMVRGGDGEYYVLEDNLRTPSGVSYMLENRKMMMRLYPELFAEQRIAPVERYPSHLLQTLRESSPINDPTVVVLTPGASTAPTSNTASWRSRWGLSWWKAPTCSSRTGRSLCVPPPGLARWM